MPIEMPGKVFVKDGHMITRSGELIDLFNPNPSQIHIEDIAHGLSNICRWNGQTGEFFSVAQHTILGTARCPDNRKAQWLLHDAEEAYFGDIIKPVKNLFPELEEAADNMRQIIYRKFNIEYIYDDVIRHIDKAMLDWDWNNLIGENYKPGLCWTPTYSKELLLQAFDKYNIK